MKTLTCIVCPMGCSLAVEEGSPEADGFPALTVTGNRCPRGAVYAREEIRAPRRIVTATCGVRGEGPPGRGGGAGGEGGAEWTFRPEIPRRLPVKTTSPCPREKIPALLADIYRTEVRLPVSVGDTVLSDWQGSGINVVAVRSLP
jgi:CxxC motif-containing protein